MLFKNKFYSVTKEVLTEGLASFKITIHDNHKIFNGHFPDNPITPGVVQMEIVKELLSGVAKSNLNLISMGNCKFLAILNPKENPTVDLVIKYTLTEDNQYKVSAQIKTAKQIYLKLSALYQ